MKQILISIILLFFLSGCSVHFVREPSPRYVQSQKTVYVTKYKPKVIYKHKHHKHVYKHVHKHYKPKYKYHKHISKKKKKVVIRYY